MDTPRKLLRVPGAPRGYRRALENGRREEVRRPVGIDRAASLKVAWWRGSVVPERSLPSHDFVSIFLHLGGADVRRADGPPEHARFGDAILPGWLEAEAWESEGVFEWCQFYIARPLFDEVAGERFDGDREPMLVERSVAESPAVARVAWQARHEIFFEDPSDLQLDSWAVRLSDAWLADCAKRSPEPVAGRKGPRRSRAVARAIEFAEANVDRSVSLEEMASAAGVSRFHLVRLFREFTGETPAVYARELRIERSKRLLLESRRPISEIALACGFADQSHFTVSFLRSTGLTPAAFRREA